MLYPIIRRVRRPLLPVEPSASALVVVAAPVIPAVEAANTAVSQDASRQEAEVVPVPVVAEQPVQPITTEAPLVLAPEESPKAPLTAKAKRAKATDNK